MPNDRTLVLASASPRRSAILSRAGYAFETRVADVDEVSPADGVPWQAVAENARRKARAVPCGVGEVVLGADTILVLTDEWLGKPADRGVAAAMLALLAGRVHRVATAVCLTFSGGEEAFVEETQVRMRSLTPAEIAAYHDVVNPLDKAGAYNIDEHGPLPGGVVEAIEGSFVNVMGLPLERLAPRLSALGIEPESPPTESANE